jgi:hypothetical protein
MQTKRLDNSQLEHFNTELMLKSYWESFLNELNKRIDTSASFTLLDIGGGTGLFADKLLELYPKIEITILDNSEYLLSLNKTDSRKVLVNASATNIPEFLKHKRFDIITVNWVLHHLIGETRKESLGIITDTLLELKNLLNTNGNISVIENLYSGILIDSFPSRFIYFLTSIKNPVLSGLIRKAGFNTAGTGVCFMSEKILRSIINDAGLKIEASNILDSWGYNIAVRTILHTHPAKITNLWLK